jgi:hypothetical protein
MMLGRRLTDEEFERVMTEARASLGDEMVDRVLASANRLFCYPEDEIRASIMVAVSLLMTRGQPRTIQ